MTVPISARSPSEKLSNAGPGPILQLLLLMGVAGSGKTTIGQRVAERLGWPYFEADDFHTSEAKAKMRDGIPLTDEDRAPWLTAIRAKMDACRVAGQSAVFTCSGLKECYRTALLGGTSDVTPVFLTADFDTILERVNRRQGHYMKADMVRSQFEALEPPADALTIDVRQPLDEIVQIVIRALGSKSPA